MDFFHSLSWSLGFLQAELEPGGRTAGPGLHDWQWPRLPSPTSHLHVLCPPSASLLELDLASSLGGVSQVQASLEDAHCTLHTATAQLPTM